MKISIFKISLNTLALMLMVYSSFTLAGCEQKEKVLDVETPSGELEIERDKSDGSVGVELNKKE
ncbi:hypothetical protein [Gimesia sp.]|uniref:hypothetical protein n=1 Tax=Gimesia sp. TaxID=2024833 RepID=UPI0032EC895A